MRKTKNVLVGLLILVLSVFALSGCKKMVLDGDGMVNSEPVSEPTDVTEPAVTEPSVQKGIAAIYNDRLIFRLYGSPAIDMYALGADYSDYNYPYTNNPLYAYDFSGSEAKEFMEDKGYGNFYIVGDMLYSQEKKEAGGSFVYCRDLKSGDYTVICNGEIRDFTDEGKYFVVDGSNYEFEEYNYFLYDTVDLANPVTTITFESGNAYNYQLIGLDDSYVYFIRNDDDHYTVVCYNHLGEEFALATYSLKDQDYSYGVYEGDYRLVKTSTGLDLEFTLNHYEGTGLFYAGCTSISVKVNPGIAQIPEANKYFNEGDTDPKSEKQKDVAGFVNPTSKEGESFITSIWKCQNLERGTFFIVADSVRDPMGDIGWRYSYYLLNLHYYFLESGSASPVLLKDMYQPGGTVGMISEISHTDTPPSIYAFARFVGKPGEKSSKCLYQMAEINGPEAPIDYSNVYSADISDDCLFETLASENLDDWEIKDFDGFTADMKENAAIYIDSLPEKDMFSDSYEIDNDFNFENSFCCHLGFDKDGKINYIRPVIMD